MLIRLFLIVLMALPLAAQDAKKAERTDDRGDAAVYKLDYLIVELEGGKRIEARDYSLLVDGTRIGRVRIGTRVPIVTGPSAFNYLDVGVSIDATVRHASPNGVYLSTKVDVTSMAMGEKGGLFSPQLTAQSPQPTMRNFKTENEITVVFGKPTVLFTMDEPSSKRTFQIQLTATHAR